ncbi:hypothetical protein B0H67DRAFT_671831 [Lasiosphaeris hirsuta]|uniref:Ankyrin repeat protein n=1 Tax=Lasiosphaeris hirsuta TaxID=260670 RepID=A0AA40DLI0_9PEZI|nr:hypothetical protein B0H67DRAFT_671831 [Lasiosphaeris hirsuta]
MEDENEAGAAGKIGPPPIVVHSDPGHQSTGHQDEGSSVPRGGTRAVAEALLTRMKSQRQPEVKKMSDVAQSRGKEEGHGSKLAEEATVPIPIDNVNNLALQHPSRIDILRPVDPGQPHYIDVVAVHDYDETSVNWAYVDNKVIVRQKLEMIRAERSKIPENSEQATAADVHDERGRQPLMVASGMPASSLAPNLAPPGRSVSRAPSLREAAKGGDAARRDDKIAVPGLSVEARDVPHVTNRNFEVGSSRASSQSRREVGSNWLQDANMLPEALLGARVLGFSYYSRDLTQLLKDNSEQSKKPDFIEKTSRELLRELCEFRQSDSFDNVPIIFIGAGFGGLVVQKAISLVVSNTDSGGEDPYSKTLGRLELGALEDQVVPEPPHLNLDHIADVIFMDTPFPSPKKEGEGLQNFFPLSASSVRISGIQKVVKKMETEWDSPGVDKIWGEFWALLYQRNQKVRIAWLYSSTASITTGSVRMNIPLNLKKTSQISAERKSPAIVLNRIPLHRSGLRRLTSFSDAKDYGYTVTISRIRESLMIRAVQDDKLEDLQLSLMKAGVSVDVNDEWGMSLLHLAATAPNPDGLKILLDNNADPQTKDSKGQTPLHSSIRMYCDSEVDAGIMMENLKRVIEKLLDFTTKPELNLNTDNQKWTIRDILQPHRHRCSGPGCTHETIRDLIARHRPFVRKRKTDDKDEAWKNWEPPADGSIQQRACEGTKAIIAEFYSTKEDKASSDYDRPSVLDLIYHRESGPADILTKKAETNISRLKGEEDVYCRWIHVPANNEQWIHDLFLRLRLRDNSMNGQRHKGYKVFSEYMTADAKQYKHSSLSKTSKGQQPTLHSIPELQADGVEWHQLPSPKGITGVSDAIAIFVSGTPCYIIGGGEDRLAEQCHRRCLFWHLKSTGQGRR